MHLPGRALERDYRRHLGEAYGVTFNQLFVLTNMPIQRFGSTLVSKGLFEEYVALHPVSGRPRGDRLAGGASVKPLVTLPVASMVPKAV